MDIRHIFDEKSREGAIGEIVYILNQGETHFTLYVVASNVRMHKHLERDEFYYILRGKGILCTEEESREIKKDDFFLVPKRFFHSLKRTSDPPLEFLIIANSKYDQNDVVYHS